MYTKSIIENILFLYVSTEIKCLQAEQINLKM